MPVMKKNIPKEFQLKEGPTKSQFKKLPKGPIDLGPPPKAISWGRSKKTRNKDIY